MNTRVLIFLLCLDSSIAFLSTNRGRAFRPTRSFDQAAATVLDPELSNTGTPNVDSDLLGNRSTEWFMPRIGGLTPADLRTRNRDEGVSETANGRRHSMQDITSPSEFQDFLASDDRLTLVLYHADFCKTCQRFKLRYDKIASLYSDKLREDGSVEEQGQIRMSRVEYTANSELCKSLDVETFPSVHFYKGERKISEFLVAPDKFDQVQAEVEQFLEDEDSLTTGITLPKNKKDELIDVLLEGEKLVEKVLLGKEAASSSSI